MWFCGSSEISVADLSDLKMTEYGNFLPTLGPNKDPVALRTVMKDNGEKIVVSFIVDNTFGVAYQHKAIKEAHVYLLPEVAPGCILYLTLVKSLQAMDAGAENDDLMFVAGQSEANETTRQPSGAIIGCINMAYHLTPVAQYRLQNPRYSNATSIRRIRASVNEFLVGVMQGVVVVYFDHNSFREITSFDNLHSGSLDLHRNGRRYSRLQQHGLHGVCQGQVHYTNSIKPSLICIICLTDL